MRWILAFAAMIATTFPSRGDEPPPVPATRPGLKQLLEDSKRFKPRLNPPAPSADEAAAARTPFGSWNIRNLLPRELRGGYFLSDGRMSRMDRLGLFNPKAPETAGGRRSALPSVERDPNMTLDYDFKVMLFWLVSRSNNCVYCMGHQENKLLASGVSEDRIAALDCDWSSFTLAERAAFAFARKLTVEPHTITTDDVEAVRAYFTDLQVLEIIGTVAGFNAMNRWTGALRLTQEDFRVFLTPTPAKYESAVTTVGPIPDGAAGGSYQPVAMSRPPLEPRSIVEAKWAECRKRTARLPLVDESVARALLPDGAFGETQAVPQWARLLANFPKGGPPRIVGLRNSETKGNLPAKLKAELAWASARADRAWYALALARDRMRGLGMGDDAIFAIDEADRADAAPAERAALAFARKLTVDPALIADADFDSLRAFYSEAEIAELIHHVNNNVFLNVLTEAAGLPLED